MDARFEEGEDDVRTLAEPRGRGRSGADRAAFASAYAVAQATLQRASLDADAAVEPWLRAHCAGRVFTHQHAQHAHLYAERATVLGRKLTPREAEGLGNLVRRYWPEYAAAHGIDAAAIVRPMPALQVAS